MQAFREMKVQETMLDGFVRQLEVAKIDEAKEGVPMQIVDMALPAEIRSLPQRTKMVTAAASSGLGIGLLLGLLRAAIRRFGRLEGDQKRWDLLCRSWGYAKQSRKE
jgi:uncharacterized protein involved in exopolysaccharide biosynthesis